MKLSEGEVHRLKGRALRSQLRKRGLGVFVHVLDLSSRELGDSGAEALSIALQGNETVKVVKATWNTIGDRGACAISAALAASSTLTSLDLSFNEIADEGCRAICEGMEQSGLIVELAIAGNLIGDEGMKAMAKAFSSNVTLTKLNLANNKIGDKGVEALGRAIQVRNKALSRQKEQKEQQKKPNMGHSSGRMKSGTRNSFVSPAGRRLSRLLPLPALHLYHAHGYDYKLGGLPLLHLDLSYNELHERGARAVAQAVASNPIMEVLDLTGNHIQNEGLENFRLQHMSLGDNGIDDRGASQLARVVRTSHSLKSLDLSYNRIHHAGDEVLSRASGRGNLAKMMARPHVDLSSNWGAFG